MNNIITCLVILLLASPGGVRAGADKTTSPRIIEYGTKQFCKFVETANISPQQAYDRLLKEMDKHPAGRYSVHLYVSIDNEYVFTQWADKRSSIWLAGFYVNADTGAVRFRQLPSPLDHSERYWLKHIYHSDYFKPKKSLPGTPGIEQ